MVANNTKAQEEGTTTIVTVTPQAALAIALHCRRHAKDSVHGLLLGSVVSSSDSNSNSNSISTVTVQEAVPVTHGAPTAPVVETALGLLAHSSSTNSAKNIIVGWYTAPALLIDTRPGPLALRMVANLAAAAAGTSSSNTLDPILLVVQNEALANVVRDAKSVTKTSKHLPFLKSFGRDSGNQWLKPIATTNMEQMDLVAAAIQTANEQSIVLSDLIDYFEECSSSPSKAVWFPNDKVAALVAK
jgi:Uncharacterised protein family (UPF0172)